MGKRTQIVSSKCGGSTGAPIKVPAHLLEQLEEQARHRRNGNWTAEQDAFVMKAQECKVPWRVAAKIFNAEYGWGTYSPLRERYVKLKEAQ